MSSAPPPAGLGVPRVHLRSTDSTNERARELAMAGAPAGTLVTAGEQSAGRGRQGRRWSAPAGSSILMSLVLHSPPPLLPLIAAVAVCDVVGEGAMIKWPNDVVTMRDGPGPAAAKLAGILVEGRPQEAWAVLGIGLNVAVSLDELPPELRPPSGEGAGTPSVMPAASMGLRASEVEPTLARLLGALESRLSEPAAVTLAAWRERDALRGRQISWNGGQGRAEGIDGNGRLIVSLPDGGRRELTAGEVHLSPIAAG